ncbi:MAG: peptide chain release factor N(5)-glutamine methyltransferase [Dehalococcoidales bacterium]|nr:MAG: peptide chain release factor N(5)-glutamine methyltransferase [Dehalococcoidales bacterium]
MTVKQALSHAREMLANQNIEDPALETELLLRHVLRKSRAELLSEPDHELSPAEVETFLILVNRRLNGEPTAYITGHREFYGHDFHVNPTVLIPRPESELLVERALQLAHSHNISTIADIGTGCGAIAISLALDLHDVEIYATDISRSALEVARFNYQQYDLTGRICLLEGNMLDPLPRPVDLITANLPYVTDAELTRVNTFGFEPSLALNGGPDGLDKISLLCRQTHEKLCQSGYLLLEIGQGQRKTVCTLLRDLFPLADIEVIPDLSGIDRVVSLSLP